VSANSLLRKRVLELGEKCGIEVRVPPMSLCLDNAAMIAGLGSKMGLDATHKWPGETTREWGRVIVKDEAVTARVDASWKEVGID